MAGPGNLEHLYNNELDSDIDNDNYSHEIENFVEPLDDSLDSDSSGDENPPRRHVNELSRYIMFMCLISFYCYIPYIHFNNNCT